MNSSIKTTQRLWTTADAMKGDCDFEFVGEEIPERFLWNELDYIHGLCVREDFGTVIKPDARDAVWEWRHFYELQKRFMLSGPKVNEATESDHRYLPRDKATNVIWSPLSDGSYAISPSRNMNVRQRGMYSCPLHGGWGEFLCSPLLVMKRIYSPEPVVVVFAEVGRWKVIRIPAALLNDSGAKLRALLLGNGVNVTVYPQPRRRLMHYILNATPLANSSLHGGLA